MVPSMPCAGGTADAENIPRTPQMISSVVPFLAKPAPRQKMENRNMDPMNMDLRPNRSATEPKNRSNDPAVREVAVFIQVISAVVIPRSLPAKDDITVIAPVKKAVMATAIVADKTNKHS